MSAQRQFEDDKQQRVRQTQHQQEKDGVGQYFARHGRPESAAQPAKYSKAIRCFDIEANGIGRRRHHNDLQYARYQGGQQEKDIVQGRVEQRMGLNRNRLQIGRCEIERLALSTA